MAALNYATLGGVKRRLDITDSVDDAVLGDIIADVNQDVEDMTGRQVGPLTITNELLDGYDALEDGMCMLYPRGLRSITTLELASGTGETFATVPTADRFIRPSSHARPPDWPGFEIWLTDVPSASNTLNVFLPGYENVRLNGAGGWAAIPSTLTSAAETTAVRTFLSNRAGHTEGSEDTGIRNYRALWRDADMHTVNRFALKTVEII
jgi:hypothetical protein